MMELERRRISNSGAAFQRLYDLYEAVRILKPMNYFLVTDQDPDKVLEIFVRVNSGGTTLSYSDLLLSMATNQWRELDAREEVRSLVSDLNGNAGRQFSFSKDVVLKTALSIAGVDVRFKVSNFTQANMAKVEASWTKIEGSLLRAATLLQQFGYNERNLTANSVIIPVAQYLHLRNAGDSYLDSSADAADRLAVQRWVTRSLIKRGIWGSGLDTTLTRIRDVLVSQTIDRFPVEEVEAAMAAVGKALSFTTAEIDELLNLKYAGQRTFSVLSVLYPGLDLGKKFHEDHIFAKSSFTKKRLVAAGIPENDVDAYLEAFNLLPNLQLLAGTVNIEKQDASPLDWIGSSTVFPTEEKRRTYLAENDLDDLPLDLGQFLDFFEQRKGRMRDRLTMALGVTAAPSDPES
jgi:predicted ester cyclase